jgi:hypothetical protein
VAQLISAQSTQPKFPRLPAWSLDDVPRSRPLCQRDEIASAADGRIGAADVANGITDHPSSTWRSQTSSTIPAMLAAACWISCWVIGVIITAGLEIMNRVGGQWFPDSTGKAAYSTPPYSSCREASNKFRCNRGEALAGGQVPSGDLGVLGHGSVEGRLLSS